MTVSDYIRDLGLKWACEYGQGPSYLPKKIVLPTRMWDRLCEEAGYSTRIEKKLGATYEVTTLQVTISTPGGEILVEPEE